MDARRKRDLATAALAILLLPTAYAMLMGHFLLAAICVGGIVLVRVIGISKIPPEDDDE